MPKPIGNNSLKINRMITGGQTNKQTSDQNPKTSIKKKVFWKALKENVSLEFRNENVKLLKWIDGTKMSKLSHKGNIN